MTHLANETSPYLLQHRDNPVDWHPWGPEALAEAERRNVPILLSVGYAACHWCHVMAHESFENADIAAVMNEHFVNIKVDREERPDIDQIYMSALHALGQPGGWPLTMVLTPKGEPIWGGTYFPPTARYGRPGFVEVLKAVTGLYKEGSEKLLHMREALMAHLQAGERAAGSGRSLTRRDLDGAVRQLAGLVDPVHGGVKGAPKFPSASFLELLWRGASRLQDPSILDLFLRSVERMCRGGIHDHLGGGFARYAVDERWLVPHFEKMLCDNAQLLELVALAHHETGQALFGAAADGIVSWLTREMMVDGTPAFASSLDADSQGEEGRFYVWTKREIEAVLSPADAALFCRLYDVSDAGNWEGRVILNRLEAPEPAPDEAARLAALTPVLLQIRERRARPGRDDKILADWNGLMIAALVRAGVHFDRPDWITLARDAFDFVASTLERDGRLGHSWRKGKLLFPGFSSDHAAMIRAALALSEALADTAYIAKAVHWADLVERDYGAPDGAGYALTAADAPGLIIRPRPTLDEATPNPNAVLAESFVRLAAMTGDDVWRARADHLLAALSGAIAGNIFGHAGLLNALDARLACAAIALTGSGERRRGALRQAALALPFPTRTVAMGEGAQSGAILCVGERCSRLLKTPAELAAAHAAMRTDSRETDALRR